MKINIKEKELICQVCGNNEWESKYSNISIISNSIDSDVERTIKILECTECEQILWFNEGCLSGDFVVD